MRNLIIVLSLLYAVSCKSPLEENDHIKVKYSGALKTMMHEGDISAKIDLKNFEHSNHFYALGALENLKGEIQIFDSKPFNTLVGGNKIVSDTTFEKKATLLVYASVEEWITLDISPDILTYDDLEKFIEESAQIIQININKPFPFLIEGKVNSLDWHVINWKDGDKEHSHEKHISSGLQGTLTDRDVYMLGFYSNSHRAIFTHHTTNMHIHLKTKDNKIAGHADDLKLGKEMTLMLPKIKK